MLIERCHVVRQLKASRCLLALAFAIATASTHAAIYKWVDEKGVTHYSEKPPAGKKPAEVPIRTQPSPTPTQGSPSPSSSKTWQEQEAEFQQRRVEREEWRMKGEALDQAAAERARACVQARQDLHALEQQRPVYTINANGERVYIEDKDRDQVRARMQQIVEQNCKTK